jgi:hypothetical protein
MSDARRVTPGLIERCVPCGLSFTALPGESTSALIHRYTAWRELHASYERPAPPEPAAPPEPDITGPADAS